MIKATLRNPALRKRASQFGRLVRHSAVTPLSGETHKPRLVNERGAGSHIHRTFKLFRADRRAERDDRS